MALLDIKYKNKPTRYFSSKQEKRTANLLGGVTTKNSGATTFQKGDVYTDLIQLELKTQTKHKETFTIKKEWLEKNLEETLITGKKYSVLAFNYGPDEKNYYILDENTFIEFLNLLENKK